MNTEEIHSNLIKSYNNYLENIIIEALKIKGYSFENRNELLSFVEENVSVKNSDIYINTYYVKSIPFLQQDYSPKIDFENNKFNANFGTYKLL
jgi:hypothetical protein